MILVDANILLYAENRSDSYHRAARQWWQQQLSGADPVCLTWVIISAFIRIGTSHRVFSRPLSVHDAADRVSQWLECPCVRVIHPTSEHWKIFNRLLVDSKAGGNLVTDAHLAALAIEHGCELCSTDSDFARFSELRWRNPLSE